jgi:hypothetical protein
MRLDVALCHIFSILAFLVDFYAPHVVSHGRTLESSENTANGPFQKPCLSAVCVILRGILLHMGVQQLSFNR